MTKKPTMATGRQSKQLNGKRRKKGRDGRQRMTERLMTVKTQVTRSRSEHLNSSRHKHAGDEEAENKQKLLFQC